MKRKALPPLNLQSGATKTGSNRKSPLREDCTHMWAAMCFRSREGTGLTSHGKLGFTATIYLVLLCGQTIYNTFLIKLLRKTQVIRKNSLPEAKCILKSYRMYKMVAGHFITFPVFLALLNLMVPP